MKAVLIREQLQKTPKQNKTELNPKILSGGMFVANVKSLTYQMFLTWQLPSDLENITLT